MIYNLCSFLHFVLNSSTEIQNITLALLLKRFQSPVYFFSVSSLPSEGLQPKIIQTLKLPTQIFSVSQLQYHILRRKYAVNPQALQMKDSTPKNVNFKNPKTSSSPRLEGKNKSIPNVICQSVRNREMLNAMSRNFTLDSFNKLYL